MIKDEIKAIKSDKKDLRNFGLVVGGVFTALGLIALLRHKPIGPYFMVPGVPLLILGLVAPSLLKPLQKAWMSLAVVMGFFMTKVILSIVYFLVLTPLGLCMRLFGKRMLDLKFDRSRKSYWIAKDTGAYPKAQYEKQF